MPRTPTENLELRRLKDSVARLRQTVIELMSPNIRELLSGYQDCEDRAAAWSWVEQKVEEVIQIAEIQPAESMGEYRSSGHRAYCPLCGGGALGPTAAEGFSWPEGLRRHLLGGHNAYQCGVMWCVQEAAIEASESDFLRHLRKTIGPS